MRFLPLLILISLPLHAITWTYVTSDGKNNLRQRIDDKIRNFRLNSKPCRIDEVVKRGQSDETRAVICELTDELKVTTIAACTTVAGKVTNVNVGDLSFIQGTTVHSVILICE